jgi:hypothetical protein
MFEPMPPEEHSQRRMKIAVILMAVCGVIFLAVALAQAHEAVNLEGKPLGFNWPPECCGSRDCAFIPASSVKETPDGYRVTLRAGQHPMLFTKGYTDTVPYSRAKTSPTGDYAICLSAEGMNRFCFFAGGRNF